MGRIRSLKPEFPQSETIGRLSRDGRLLFLQLFTIADDEGRARAASRMLASLLYPYDGDAPDLISGWLDELELNGCIQRYLVDGSSYLEITNWLKHQKIDKPSKSRLPPYSGIVANPREPSRTLAPDLGPRIEDQDQDSALRAANAPPSDIRTDLFGQGLRLLAEMTGRTPTSCRSLVGRWLKLTDDEAVHVLAAIEDAHRERVADPSAWITRRLQSLHQTSGLSNGHKRLGSGGFNGNWEPARGSREDLRRRTSQAADALKAYAFDDSDEPEGCSQIGVKAVGGLPKPGGA